MRSVLVVGGYGRVAASLIAAIAQIEDLRVVEDILPIRRSALDALDIARYIQIEALELDWGLAPDWDHSAGAFFWRIEGLTQGRTAMSHKRARDKGSRWLRYRFSEKIARYH